MAQYDSAAVIPIVVVCRDYFASLKVPTLLRKISAREIALPLVRMETSQKGAKGVHLTDLAGYIDKRRNAAIKECNQLAGVVCSGAITSNHFYPSMQSPRTFMCVYRFTDDHDLWPGTAATCGIVQPS
ncbi:pyocin activator PrtN family protein [Paraburkholderia sp. UYCP14C]|uniref:pyocin activator PrtN family protein n=1 Tax=Paraburkholderia sp. UYCP14C TaxID=2511130 RepID=UPI0027D21A53|nr:pyocin activator PrtN family protein [Paraburkholderia sp. UYCP14C]